MNFNMTLRVPGSYASTTTRDTSFRRANSSRRLSSATVPVRYTPRLSHVTAGRDLYDRRTTQACNPSLLRRRARAEANYRAYTQQFNKLTTQRGVLYTALFVKEKEAVTKKDWEDISKMSTRLCCLEDSIPQVQRKIEHEKEIIDEEMPLNPPQTKLNPELSMQRRCGIPPDSANDDESDSVRVKRNLITGLSESPSEEVKVLQRELEEVQLQLRQLESIKRQIIDKVIQDGTNKKSSDEYTAIIKKLSDDLLYTQDEVIALKLQQKEFQEELKRKDEFASQLRIEAEQSYAELSSELIMAQQQLALQQREFDQAQPKAVDLGNEALIAEINALKGELKVSAKNLVEAQKERDAFRRKGTSRQQSAQEQDQTQAKMIRREREQAKEKIRLLQEELKNARLQKRESSRHEFQPFSDSDNDIMQAVMGFISTIFSLTGNFLENIFGARTNKR